MEVSFAKEAEQLTLGDGETFRGEAILAVAKAFLQSGVSYVGGYQGAPVSHLLDVLVQSGDLLSELGVHLETCASEASAAALLGASIHYPLRGAVTWKSIVGTNVASDALSNLASAGVTGGVLAVLGEDYGEGASVIQERSLAFALKSGVWLLDPRPDLPVIVDLVEQAFALSEASSTPVLMELRIRACHRFGAFTARDNRRAAIGDAPPAAFDYNRLSHPPATFAQEQDKLARRLPAAIEYIQGHALNQRLGGEGDLGVIVQGGLANTVLTELAELGVADVDGAPSTPMLVLNVVHPLCPDEIVRFCQDRTTVVVIEEGHPEFLEQGVGQILRRAGLNVPLHGKDLFPAAGEYTAEIVRAGLRAFFSEAGLEIADERWERTIADARETASRLLGPVPDRPPTFCTGCPERPVFSALKLAQRETGPVHVAADIGCHALATFPPFDSGQTILGYGLSLASSQAVAPFQHRRPVAVMGDGGFWHNGLITGVAGAAFNRGDQVLVVLDNGYSSATGIQAIPSTRRRAQRPASIAAAVRAVGTRWVQRIDSYRVGRTTSVLRKAIMNARSGLKVVIAEGECRLARGRRERTQVAERLARGRRTVQVRYGIDESVCTGDHACIRLSGCPSLTLRARSDPLRSDPVAHVDASCVGCGLCGELAHAAQLCPSFYRLEVVRNPRPWERAVAVLQRSRP